MVVCVEKAAGRLKRARPSDKTNSRPVSPPFPPFANLRPYQVLVGKDGQIVKRYAPTATPESLKGDIEAALSA